MKKCLMFGVVAVLLSAMSIGCSSDGGSSSSSFCRTGSLWPTARSRQETKMVYATSAQACNPCDVVSACNPCEPVCNPCDMSCTGTSVVPGGITPHAM